MASASRGLIPKKPASNSAAPATKPPARAYESPPSPGPEEEEGTVWLSQSLSEGKPEIASVPDAISSQNSSGLLAPPGNRQPSPTIAIGSCWTASICRRRRRVSCRSAAARLRYSKSFS